MKIVTVDNYYTNENCYILINNGEAVIIDPGSPAEEITERAEGAEIKYILLTHCHYDHILGVEELREQTGAKLIASNQCAENAADIIINLTKAMLDEPIELKPPEIILSPRMNLCGIDIEVIETPGHTSCGVCFLIGKRLFSGDTLFLRNIGRMDLPTGDEDTLKASVRNCLYTLDDDIEVYPGHGGKTTVGYEKKYNLSCKQIR